MTPHRHRNVGDGRIWLAAYPPDHAETARRAGYYVEAIQVLHGWIELKLQEWLLLSRHHNIRGSYEVVWESAFGIPLLQVAKALFTIGKMNKTTFDAVGPSITVSEYSKAFEYGIRLSNRLEGVLARLATRGAVGRGRRKIAPRSKGGRRDI